MADVRTIPDKHSFAFVLSLAELRKFSGSYANQPVRLAYGTTPGDGLEGDFYWSNQSVEADDGVSTVAVDNVTTGRWKKLYGSSAASATVASIVALKALAKPTTSGTVVNVWSYYASATPDGGGGQFVWDSTSSATANDGTIIAPDAGGVGRWRRVYDGVISVKQFGAKGDNSTNDHAAWTAWTNFVQDGTGRRGFIPSGRYLIDSWTIGGYDHSFDGEVMGTIGQTSGVHIKARATVTNFVTINGVGHEVSNVLIDGNNFATNTVRFTNTMSDVTFRKVRTTGAVNNGIDWNFEPITPNVQVDLSNFYDCVLSGRSGGTGLTGIWINNPQTLRMAFHSTTISDYQIGFNLNNGQAALNSVFFTTNTLNDIKFTNGQLVVLEGRSESVGIDSVYIAGGTTSRVVLIEYVHASSASPTSLNIASGFTGNLQVIGGLYNNIANASATAGVTLMNPEIVAGGVLYGTGADNVVWIKDSLIRAPRMASVQNVPTYGTTVTINAALGDVHTLIVNDGVAWTLAAPTNPTNFQEITLEISNTSGGAMGAITVNTSFKTAGVLVAPATAFRRFYAFRYNGANWIEQWRSAADTPN